MNSFAIEPANDIEEPAYFSLSIISSKSDGISDMSDW